MASIDLKFAMDLAPEKAIAYFVSKGFEIGWDWEDIWQQAHAKAFTVAKVTRLDILQDIQEMVTKSLEDGISFQQFKKELMPKLKAKGWWGRKEEKNPITGELEFAQLGSAWRLETIYRVNTQTAYMSGRYAEQIENVDDRPYWQYVAILDSNTRPAHRAMDGLTFRYDDPFWSAFYPPNGWNCRCRVRAVTVNQATRSGIHSSAGRMGTKMELVSRKTGELKEVTTYKLRDRITGRDITVAPDVGWSYNPGQAAYETNLQKYTGSVAALAQRELR